MIFTLPILSFLPFVVAIFLFFLSMFFHLNFKLIPIKKVRIAMAILGALFGYSFFMAIYRLHIEYDVMFAYMHFLFAIVMFTLSFLFGMFSGRFKARIVELGGVALFFASAFFLLV